MGKILRNIINGKRTIDISLPGDKKLFIANFQDFLNKNKNYRGRIENDRIELMKRKMSFDDSLSFEGFNPSLFCSFRGSVKEKELGRISIAGTIELNQIIIIIKYIFILLGIILFISQTWRISFRSGLTDFGIFCSMILFINVYFELVKLIYKRNLKDIVRNNYVA